MYMYVCACVYVCTNVCVCVCMYVLIYSVIRGTLYYSVSISAYIVSNDRKISKKRTGKWKVFESGHCLN
jgi:hypothetical protein